MVDFLIVTSSICISVGVAIVFIVGFFLFAWFILSHTDPRDP